MAVTYDNLLEQLVGLRQDLATSGINFDAIPPLPIPGGLGIQSGTQSFFPSLKTAAKSMLRHYNPEITKDQADLIFDSEDEIEAKDEEKARKRREKEEFKALPKEQQEAITEAEKAKRREERDKRRAKRRAERRKKVKQYKEIYRQKIKEWEKYAEQRLKEIKDSLLAIFTGFIDIVKRLISAIVMTASGIAGIIQIIVAPPYNVANAITQVMKIIAAYLNIVKAIQDLNPYFRIFDIMPIFIDKNKLRVIASIFKPIIQALRVFFIPIKKFNELILKLLKWIQDFLNKRKDSIFRKATKKLKKLGHLYRNWFIHPQMKGEISILGVSITFPFFPGNIRGDFYPSDSEREYPCYAFEDEDTDEIQGLLDTFIVGFENTPQNRVIAYRRKPSEDASDLAKTAGLGFGDDLDYNSFDFEAIADQFDKLPGVETEIEIEPEDDFIYDIELPDGTIIQNVTEEGVEFYKQNFILKYVNAVTQAIQTASTTSQ